MSDRALRHFRRFPMRLNVMAGNGGRMQRLAALISQAVKRMDVPPPKPPVFAADEIENVGEPLRRSRQRSLLLIGRF
jgi:hypothetical protein